MKFLFDLFPLIIFFAAYLAVDIFFATAAGMTATVLQVAWSWLRHKKVDKLLWVNFGAFMFFGGLTLIFQDERFLKVKPTIVYWIIAAALIVSYTWFKKNPIRMMMEAHFDAPNAVWRQWLIAWVIFFAVLGVLNMVIAYFLSTDLWVKFKVFGGLALTFTLAIAQTWSLMPYAKNEGAN